MSEGKDEKTKKMAHFEVEMDDDHSHDRKSFGQKLARTGSAFTKSTRAWMDERLNPHNFTEQQKHGLFDMASNVVLLIIFYCAMVFMMGGNHMLPGDAGTEEGKMFCLILIWFCSLIAGWCMDKIGMPPLLGMLLSGMILKNWQYLSDEMKDPVANLPATWSEGIRAAGLSVILMRSGLELDIPQVKKAGLAAVRLTCLPGILEAFVVAAGGVIFFDMEFPLAISMGFILAAVSPAVVVVGMFNLQKGGYGVHKGIPSLVVAAASFDDVVAISGFSIAISFAIPHNDSDEGHSMFMTLMHGPLEIILGVILGMVGGHILAMTKVWNMRWKRTAITFGLGMAFMFGMLDLGFSGAGAMGGLIMGMVASVRWRDGTPTRLAKRKDEHYIHQTESDLAAIWSLICQPLLFGVIGSALDFGLIPVETIPKSMLVCFIGLCFRLPMAFVATYGKGLTEKERAFVALSWIPKATVQAALCAVPLQKIKDAMENDPHYSDAEFEKWEKWGYDVLTTAVLSILMTAPLGLIFIQVLGPRWLSHDIITEDDLSDTENDPLSVESLGGLTEEERILALASSLDGDLKTILTNKLNAAEHLVEKNHGKLSHSQLEIFQKQMFFIKKIAEISNIDAADRIKVLDTPGNFFKVASSHQRRVSGSISFPPEKERSNSAPETPSKEISRKHFASAAL
mmetsp:Transcript_18971/g.39509  ORF Transcript_18971/g.39509 Transcript_18971/m.39509 type:complete len:682 (-) Transcript_18971:73-2118(-)|eukprot:CAMPEP_0118652020 /NCGR_PEP_ID=MMETSP0785-20121206/11093_1 /TAXON_ID=91992 /ORGANISM="Bolidomonas pacifica, Strain CCMP 1866" /LENGTH=681 /DNA_ID=CAMNT_0006544505 /DNA_START=719 /DNA_END=2764 /DNA_ORIENTATION=+